MQLTKIVRKELILEFMIFIGGMASIVIFYQNNFLLTFLLATGWLIGILFWHKNHDIYFYVAGAILGPLSEIVAIYFGAWEYTNPSFLGIPIWLPFAWGLVTMMLKRISETFVKIEMR